MEHAAAIHDVESPADPSKLENVGLAEGDIGQSQSQGLALGIAEARQAEIDGQHQGAFEVARRFDEILPGSTARNEDVDPVMSTQFGARSEPVPAILRHSLRLAGRSGRTPTWNRVVLVLLLDLERDVIGNGGEVRNEIAREPLVQG